MSKFSLVPQETKFYDLFAQSAHNVLEIATALKELLDDWQDVETKVAHITDLEHKGDTITHQVMDLLYRSFITPFDREDISLLAHTLDDVADFIHAAVDAMYIYHIKGPHQAFPGTGQYPGGGGCRGGESHGVPALQE